MSATAVRIRSAATGVARRAVKEAASAFDVVRHPPSGIVILLYHRVGAGTASEVDLPVDQFDEQLGALAATGAVIDLDAAVSRLEASASSVGPDAARPASPGSPCSGIVLTFDDGTADFVDHAVPLLVRHGLPATLYLATGAVAEGRPFWGDGEPLTWRALRDARSTGLVTVGSHTHGHALLDRATVERATDEIDRSVGLIEDELGVTPAHFAYPKAVAPSAAIEALVRRRFRSAALAGTRPNPCGTDPHRLTRSPVQRADGRRFFARKMRGGMGLEDRIREQVDRRRYAGRTT